MDFQKWLSDNFFSLVITPLVIGIFLSFILTPLYHFIRSKLSKKYREGKTRRQCMQQHVVKSIKSVSDLILLRVERNHLLLKIIYQLLFTVIFLVMLSILLNEHLDFFILLIVLIISLFVIIYFMVYAFILNLRVFFLDRIFWEIRQKKLKK